MQIDLKNELIDFCKTYKQNATRMLKSNLKFQHLYQYVLDMTPNVIDFDYYPLKMKICWIINDMKDFPKCPICNADILTKQYSLFSCYKKTCSYQCQRKLATLNMQNTCIDKYGVSNGGGIASSLEKIKLRHIIHYGVENVFASNWFKENEKQKNIQKYGVQFYQQTQEFLNKCKKTNLKNLGVEYPLQSKACIDKMRQTIYDTYGVFNVSQVPEIQCKQHHHYSFECKSFDSAPEIAFYIWLRDNNIEFEYQPNISFDYMYDGKVHKYFPDFRIGDICFELKGDHFFKDGKMICPYRDKHWSDAEYANVCSLYEAKHQCMLKNNIVILTSSMYKMFVLYVDETYGKCFLKQFKTSHNN